VETTGNKSKLRSVRIAGERLLREKFSPNDRLIKAHIDLITFQAESIVEEMESKVETRSQFRRTGRGVPPADPLPQVP